MPLPRYCLAHHSGISSNITNTTHLSMPPTPPTLPRSPTLACHLRYHANHVTHVITQSTLACHSRRHTNHAIMPPRHPRQHFIHASTPPTPTTLACHPCKDATYATHASPSTMQACNPRHLHYNEYHAISQIHILQRIDWFYLTRKK